MIIYISGAINGNKNYKEDFEKAENYLKQEYPSTNLVNPTWLNKVFCYNAEDEEYMSIRFRLLDMCDFIYMIDGWKDSKSCNQEYGYAKASNIGVLK